MSDELDITQRVDELAGQHPERTAITFIDRSGRETEISWRRLADQSRAAASELARQELAKDSIVGVMLPNSVDHVIVCLAAWRLGKTVLPLNPSLPETELGALLSRGRHVILVGQDPACTLSAGFWDKADPWAGAGPPQGKPRLARLTGGSTSAPRIVMAPSPRWTFPRDAVLSSLYSEEGLDLGTLGVRIGQVQLVMLPLFHAGFTCLYYGLALGHRIILCEQFDPNLVASAMVRHKVNFYRIVPTQMRALLDVPGLSRCTFNAAEAIHHGSGPCPEPVKRAWLNLVPPEVLFETYTSAESFFHLAIRGDEWLEHPGTIGKARTSEVRIVDPETLDEVPTGAVGEIYHRSAGGRQPEYIGPGAHLRQVGDFLSVGDLGFRDADGYLHLVGRRGDVLNVGGVNVYPNKLENVLQGFPDVKEVAVVGKAHRYLGQAPHAVIVLADGAIAPDKLELDAYCRRCLEPAEVPLSYEFARSLPRSDAGKLSRRELV